jgi:hypothetical protein
MFSLPESYGIHLTGSPLITPQHSPISRFIVLLILLSQPFIAVFIYLVVARVNVFAMEGHNNTSSFTSSLH